MTRRTGQRGGAAAASQADARAIDLAPVIASLWASGTTSLQAIADELNARQIPTARGGKWQITQVARVLARLHKGTD
ncbi:MAG TPA: recombinase family protein [Candidatus Binataceae bacterium]|nr:recombinase family protein [Candidatus Binataceae bacterium]